MSDTPLQTVEDYITEARTLLLDTVSPYRYSDTSLLTAFNLAILEGRRLRPDLFVYRNKDTVKTFSSVNSDQVNMEEPFRLAFVLGLCAYAMARDQEDIQDARSITFMADFRSILTGKRPFVLGGGEPSKGK